MKKKVLPHSLDGKKTKCAMQTFSNSVTETIVMHTHTQRLHAANTLSHFRVGLFYLASTHSSDLTAAFSVVPRHSREDKAVTDVMKTKSSVTSHGYFFSQDKAFPPNLSVIVTIR